MRYLELTSVSVASSVKYWRMEPVRLISMYAASHGLMMGCFIQRSLSQMKPRLPTIPANSISISSAERDCGYCMAVLKEIDDKKRIASVL